MFKSAGCAYRDLISPSESVPEQPRRVTRRGALAAAGGLAGAGLAAGYSVGHTSEAPAMSAPEPFHGLHQSGIATPQQDHLVFAAFDVTAPDAAQLQELLRSWSRIAADLQAGRTTRAIRDPGETNGLGPARLTLTFGIGPGVFEREGEDVLGLRDRHPVLLEQIRSLPGDDLQAARGGGDLCVQACADDPQVAFHAVHALTLAAHGAAVPRWSQAGFLPVRSGDAETRAPRNLMGFKDGTNNIRPGDAEQMRRHVWLDGSERSGWMRGGSYVVTRRIRMLLDVWDGLAIDQQEHVVGREKGSGRRLRGPRTHPHAHVELAREKNNEGVRILRRGYSYNDGIDPATSQIDAGLFFICFQRNPIRQFTAIQGRLGVNDALAKHLSHTSSAVFACPPGAAPGGYVGEGLFRRS
jgi:deferrochelatase/peroxidase EfeB